MKYLSFANLEIIQTEKSDGSINDFEAVKAMLPTDPNNKVIEMNQVHSDAIVTIEKTDTRSRKISATDALLTRQTGVWLMVKTADCIPLVLYDPQANAIGVVHCGWRGAVKELAQKTVTAMGREFSSKPADLKVFIGSSIRSCCYTFGEAPMQEAIPTWQKYITIKPDGWHIDLVGHTTELLRNAGVKEANIIDIGECTFHNLTHFSYFRQKKTGEEHGLNAMVVQLKQ